ncbi:MAG TPA: ATP-binding domain-containing protein [bacterium]|nr:ATP-binding domain-containing protein [bacterium]
MASALRPDARALLDEEERLLARVLAAIDAAAARDPISRSGELRSVEKLKELRDEAANARDDDLPAMLQEMSVRQRLVSQRPPDALPDTRSPYLAHLRVDEGKGPRDYLLGRVTFLDASTGVRVVDWRTAPIAQVFYKHREGDDFEEELPGRLAAGVVLARRVLVIENGALTRIIGDRLSLARGVDGVWDETSAEALALRAGGAGTATRPGALGIGVGAAGRAAGPEITALLDAEQYAAISAPASRPLLVLGSAGSGKTTVALHRLSRIAATEPETHPLSRIEVVVPEEGLARLSRRLLDGLGAREVRVRSLEQWSTLLARHAFPDKVKLGEETPPLVASLKRHPALYRALHARFSEKGAPDVSFGILRKRLAEAFTDRVFLERIVAESEGTLRTTAVEETIRHTMLQIARPLEKDLKITDASRKVALDGLALGAGTPDELAGSVDVDDLPILLCMRAWRGGVTPSGVAHLVLDEAEDFSMFELFVAGKLLDEPSLTLAGDDAQQTTTSHAGWNAVLDTCGARGAATVRLAVSYRCPRPIADLARDVLGNLAPDLPSTAAREGAPVGFFRFPGEALVHLFAAGALKDLLTREPRASVGVIANDPDTARRVYASLGGEGSDARLVLDGEFSFAPGIDVTDVDNAKGLEWDYVVVPDANAAAYPANDDARRRLHVAVTRASHQLWILAGGSPTPILPATAWT